MTNWLIAIFLALPIHAQYALAPSNAPRQITLSNAVELALTRYEAILASREKIDVQRGTRRQTLARLLPQLDLKGTLGYQTFERVSQTSTVQGLQPQGVLGLKVPLIHASSIVDTQNAYTDVEKSEASYARERERLVLDVSSAFLLAATSSRLLNIAKQQLAQSEARVESFSRRVKSGDIPALDLQREQLLSVQAEVTVQNRTTDYQLAVGKLAYFIGETESFTVIAPVNWDILAPTDSLEVLTQRAKSQRNDIEAQRLALKIANRKKLSAWLTFLPNLDLATSLSYPIYNPLNLTALGTWEANVMLQLSLPLYNGGARYGLMQEASALTRAEKLYLNLLERALSLEIQGALVDIERHQKLQTAAKTTLELAQSATRSADNMYKVAHATSLDLISAQTQLYSAESNVELTKLALQQSKLQLAFALGDDLRALLAD